ncbi:hypothetical protein MHBO_001601 [Bonamia ostreae]|uniref:Uncharacterized protein n=1 Tax=Bonamia ostreae TaxID=126728 RepID=A0ABV2AJK4_9EUKA
MSKLIILIVLVFTLPSFSLQLRGELDCTVKMKSDLDYFTKNGKEITQNPFSLKNNDFVIAKCKENSTSIRIKYFLGSNLMLFCLENRFVFFYNKKRYLFDVFANPKNCYDPKNEDVSKLPKIKFRLLDRTDLLRAITHYYNDIQLYLEEDSSYRNNNPEYYDLDKTFSSTRYNDLNLEFEKLNEYLANSKLRHLFFGGL